MSQRTTGGKYRADRRPVTPLTTLGEYVTGPVGRRAAAAAASTGIIVTLTAAGSVASPTAGAQGLSKAPTIRTVDSDSVTGGPTVSVDKDVKWSFMSATSGTTATPPPPPPPVVVAPVVNRTAQVASRSGARQAPAAPAAAPSAESSSSTQAAPSSGIGAAIVAEARRHVGTPYVWGGRSPGGFDCSGFTSYVFAQFGVSLAPTDAGQRNAGRVVSAAEARPGDLVWWPGHVGIYTGNGNHIAARNPSSPLHESPLWRGGATFIRVIE